MNNTQKMPQTPNVMLFATFHFRNPKLDLVTNRVHDVFQAESQTYLDALASRISKFSPTKILLEFDPKDELGINLKYQEYLKNKKELGLDEIEQLGYRIAKKCNLDQLKSFDNRETPWLCDDLFDKLRSSPKIEEEFHSKVKKISDLENKVHATKDLREILIHYNSKDMDQKNKELYILTNEIGAGSDFSGANAAASWWHRNFKMFALIQKYAKPNQRILAIAGQGHISIIRDLAKIDRNIQFEDINNYL